MFLAYIYQYGNIFGNIRYVSGTKFPFINYVVDIGGQMDEIGWFFSKILREHCGRDKEFVIPDKPHIIHQLYIHDNSNISFDEQIQTLIDSNPVSYHISGNYRQYNFCYKKRLKKYVKKYTIST